MNGMTTTHNPTVREITEILRDEYINSMGATPLGALMSIADDMANSRYSEMDANDKELADLMVALGTVLAEVGRMLSE
jgi:hypothetical protein